MEARNLRLLAIDDNPDNLVALRAVLSDLLPEARLLTATSGARGLELAEAEDPDVILLDIAMPQMDGYAVCRKLKENHRLSDIPVLFLTALRTDRESRIRALEAGGEGFLAKPLDETELLAQIRAMAKVKTAHRMDRLEMEHLAAQVAERTKELERELAERKRAEEALRANEARYRDLFDSMQEGFALHEILCDDSGRPCDYRYLEVNPAFERATGISRERWIGRTVREVLPHVEDYWIQQFGEVALTGKPRTFENYVRELDQHYEVAAYSPKRGQFAVIALNVTERKKLAEKLREAQKLESIGQLAGGVAHDYNNMLASMMMQLGFLQLNANLDHEIRQALNELMREVQRAANLTRQLLVFSRRASMELRPLDLTELVTNLLKMLRRLIGENIELRFDRRPGLPAVQADPGMLEQVLMNLCLNARDAMPKGGTLTIDLAVVQKDGANTRAHVPPRAETFVCLSVSDTGCGMDKETLEHIFEPFFTTKDVGKGTGLGLATVHGIVAQHNGWVDVESQAGHGTTFRVFLPAAPGEPAAAEPANRKTVLTGHETILLVEDEASLRQATVRNLKRLGYQVLEASNASEALQLWSHHGPAIDLLLSDMIMPGEMTGLELAKKLREDKPALKVIVVSGYRFGQELGDYGADGGMHIAHQQKPYETEVLSKAIRQCLDKR